MERCDNITEPKLSCQLCKQLSGQSGLYGRDLCPGLCVSVPTELAKRISNKLSFFVIYHDILYSSFENRLHST